MCILTFMPDGIDIAYDRAKECARANPDGFGFAIHARVAIIKDHDMDFEKLWLRWVDMRKSYQGPALFHFRIATHGNTDINNCHPFDVDGNPNTVVAHNGILPMTMPLNDSRSDTKLFADFVLPAIGGVESLDIKENLDNLENWAIGNKLVILTVEEKASYDWYIINEHAGHWDAGMWWSNSSYKRTYPISYVNYGYNTNTTTYKSTYKNGIYSDPLGWDKYETGYDETTDTNKWELEDTVDYLEDELYASTEIMDVIQVFTDYSNPDYATVTCYNCGQIFYVDAFEPSATHCGHCKTCLGCSGHKCNCWTEYEYPKSFIQWNQKEGTVTYEPNAKS